MASNVVHVLVHLTSDSVQNGFRTYTGLVKIYPDRTDATTKLAKLVFLSGSTIHARVDLGLTKKHPDFEWASDAMDDFVNALNLEEEDATDPFGTWAGRHETEVKNANAAGGALIKILDAQSWVDGLLPNDAPNEELLAALREYAAATASA
ncbi:hypothetical protein HYH03_013608 [Edaphochlamys debaryana]|uniref:Uncharacterized protein n=1 Tax=Edaphochlamys debaryana TaxID=47281 RepID=A0A835XRT2_9CHLO|nr:hypothetical protein HYH03_013608 [Edaphochlamys debaryana]|eukprot:KAG2487763.1 hypothetical protein HYH03_013608 [Edaphochlamys debaryana]